MGVGESRNFRGHVDGPESSEVNISSSNDNVAKFRASSSYPYGFEGYIDAVGAGTATITVSFAGNKNYKAAESKTLTVTVLAPAATGPEVAWNKAEKTGTFTMPGGNVTLEPEYYPQAALTAAPTAINDVPATTDGAIVKAGTVANIGSTETAQGTVMYYVSPTALDDAALLALAADKWTADVPTAEKLTKGEAYVYYYVRGNDSDNDEENFSDGDILSANALTVTIAAEPTYAVTFAEGTDPNEWSASPNAGVKKGQTVTVTYTGSKKVLGVKAEKKAKAPAGKTIKIGEQNYTVLDGETWKQFITRNKLSTWGVDLMTLSTWYVYMDEPYSKLHVSSDGTNWTQLVLSSQDAPIDTDKQYKWVQEEIGSGGVGGGEPPF